MRAACEVASISSTRPRCFRSMVTTWPVGARRLDTAHHARTSTPGNDNGVYRIAPVENGDDLALVARESHHVRRIGEVARENPGAVEERPAVAVQQALKMLGRAHFAQAYRRRHARRAQTNFLRAGCRRHVVSRQCRNGARRRLQARSPLPDAAPHFQAPSPRTCASPALALPIARATRSASGLSAIYR